MKRRGQPKFKLPTIRQAEKAIGWPVEKWRGNCYAVACAFVRHGLVEGTPRYGLWHGPIVAGSIFAGKPFTHHGWIELPRDYGSGTIVDPTRFEFEQVEPYIFVGSNGNGFYDFGGNALRKLTRVPYPRNGEKSTNPRWDAPVVFGVSPECRTHLSRVIGYEVSYVLTMSQLYWVGNMGLDELGEYVTEVYEFFRGTKYESAVPFDNWTAVYPKEAIR